MVEKWTPSPVSEETSVNTATLIVELVLLAKEGKRMAPRRGHIGVHRGATTTHHTARAAEQRSKHNQR